MTRCPDCHGQGWTEYQGCAIEPGCCGQPLGNGECCGNAIAVQVPAMEQQPCQLCEATGEVDE